MKNKKTYGIFALLVIVQLLTIIYSFQFRKEGMHVDEYWSYGHANSFYTREIYIDDNGKIININQWMPGEHFWDYLVVNKGEEFRFDSVYYNKERDISPFLHSMILHAICSFFPETFSRWYSFVINIISFIMCMIFLFKTAKMLEGDAFAICCCALYGFSLAARDTYIFLRMYAMSTAIIMAYIYFVLKYVRAVKEGRKKPYALLIGLSLLAWTGFMTNFYNISLVGLITFFMCIYLLCNKKIKQMFAYGFSMLISLGIACLCMPNVFGNIISYEGDIARAGYFTLSMKLKVFLNFFLKKFCNVSISIYPSPLLNILAGVLVYVLILLIPVIVLIRKEPFFKRWIEKIKYVLHHKCTHFKHFLAWVNWIYVILFAAAVLQVLVICNTADVESMNVYADRYIFFLYPIAALLFSACIYTITGKMCKRDITRRLLVCFLTVALVCVNMYKRYTFITYLFPTNIRGESIAEAVRDKNCIFIAQGCATIITMSGRLMRCKSCFQTIPEAYRDYKSDYMKKLEEGPLLLIIDMTDFQSPDDMYGDLITENNNSTGKGEEYRELIDFYESLVPESKMQELGAELVFADDMKIFIINPINER